MSVLNAEDQLAGKTHSFFCLCLSKSVCYTSVSTDELNTVYETRNPEKAIAGVMWKIMEEADHS